MHHFLTTFFIALTNNVDNVAARIAYSIRGVRISISVNIWISVITFIISSCAVLSGTTISGFLGRQLSSIIAMSLLTLIGLWMILGEYVTQALHCADNAGQENGINICHIMMKLRKADRDHSKHIDLKEATLLGIALSINNVGGGLSAGMIGLSPFWVGFLSAILNFLALSAGNYIAAFFIKWNVSRRATLAAGIILIAIGIEQVI